MRTRSVLCVVGGASLLLGLTASPASAAPSGKGRCISELAQAGLIGPELNPGRVNIVAGTDGDDVFDSTVTAGADVICGFGGRDTIQVLDAGDVFLGGEGDDFINFNNGIFDGGPGNDSVDFNTGTFNGGAGNDSVAFNDPGAVFNGGDGNDRVDFNSGTFNGGPGDDNVIFNDPGGVFNGGPGNDTVEADFGGEFNQ